MKLVVAVVVILAVLLASHAEAKRSKRKHSKGTSFEKAAIKQHNLYRQKHGVPPLKVDDKATRQAQQWANYLANNDVFEHNPDRQGFGENIYKEWSQGDKKDDVLAADAVDMWYNEVKLYTDYNNDPSITGNPELKRVGHFTQVVWKDTKGVGVAKATSKNGNTYVVANYYPPGNVKGMYVAQVLPPKA